VNKKIVLLGYGKMGKTVLDDLLRTAEFDELVVADAGPNFKTEIGMISDSRVKPVELDVDDRTDHGRTVGYPAGPARIPACEIIAPGSSEILASAKAFMPL